jgi:thioredoxin reductase (NADPH)
MFEREKEAGGQLLSIYGEVTNYPGVVARDGRELRDRFLQTAADKKVPIRLSANVVAIDTKRLNVSLENGEDVFVRSFVLATGVRRRTLGLDGEQRLAGRGVLVSGVRDRESVRGKRLVIVGGGDAAFENALLLSDVAGSIDLVHRGATFRARAEFTAPVLQNPRITIHTNSRVREIIGSDRLTEIVIENEAHHEHHLAADALLVRIGVQPNSELARGIVDLDEQGYIITGADCSTSSAGIFAIGDVAHPTAATIAGAVGNGATAAKALRSFLDARRGL